MKVAARTLLTSWSSTPAPCLPVAGHSIQIGQYVDAALLSVLRGVSQLPAIYAAQQRLSVLGVRVLGMPC